MNSVAKPASAAAPFRLVGKVTRTMSMLTTGKNPLFALANFLRDYQTSVNYGSWAASYADGVPKWIDAFNAVMRDDPDYRQWLALGGNEGMSRLNGLAPNDEKTAQNMLRDIL